MQNYFVCPQTRVTLSLPCCLKGCQYHVEKPWVKNCILCYMHQQNTDRLSPTELSFLFGMSQTKVERLINKQLSRVRAKLLVKELENKNHLTYLKNVPVCCVCDRKADTGIKVHGLTYCTRACLRMKSPHVVKIERRYSSDIGTVIGTALTMFKDIDVLATLFRLSRRKIEVLVNHHASQLWDRFVELTSADVLAPRERQSRLCEKALNRLYRSKLQFGTQDRSLRPIYEQFVQLLNAA